MKALKIDFTGGRPRIDFGATVEGFDAVVQGACVNIVTLQRDDALFPARGTRLLEAALSGEIVDAQSAQHACNFAAIDTLFFSNETDLDDVDALRRVTVTPTEISDQRMKASLSLESITGKTAGRVI